MSNDEQSGLSERTKEFFQQISESCIPRIDRATISTVGIQNNEIKHDRSGVLYRINDKHFILTADHDLRGIVENNIPLYVSVNKPGVYPIPLGDARFHLTDRNRDVAAIYLPDDLAGEITQHKDFLTHNQINLDTGESKGPFIFYGYPKDWSANLLDEESLISVALAFSGHPYDGEIPDGATYDPSLHMLLSFSRDAIRALDGGPEVDRLPHPRGVSGCGIWQVGDLDLQRKEIVPRSSDSVTLIGIQNHYSASHSYVKGTHIRHALGLIVSNYPELEQAMSIVYPSQRN